MKKYIKIFGILVLTGFSFFYTEKVTKIVRSKDPIMIKIKSVKKENYIEAIKPIINDDEYIMGINGCEIDIEKSYNKLKQTGEYKKDLLIMKEVNNDSKLKNKYIVSGNKLQKNVSLIFLIKDREDEELIKYLSDKKIKVNFFIDQKYLENNSVIVKFISKNNNIYYLGNDGNYDDKYMMYAKNLVEINSNNESKYCLLNKKDDITLNLCTEYNMKTIKTDYIKENIIQNIKSNLENGSIFTIDSTYDENIKASINYILSKGYNIVTLDKLLNSNSECKEFE